MKKRSVSPKKKAASPKPRRRQRTPSTPSTSSSSSDDQRRHRSPVTANPNAFYGDLRAIRKNGRRLPTTYACECVNKDGTQCSNNALDDSRFCSRHQNCDGKVKSGRSDAIRNSVRSMYYGGYYPYGLARPVMHGLVPHLHSYVRPTLISSYSPYIDSLRARVTSPASSPMRTNAALHNAASSVPSDFLSLSSALGR